MLSRSFNREATEKLNAWLLQKTKSWSWAADAPDYEDLITCLKDGADPNTRPPGAYHNACTFAMGDRNFPALKALFKAGIPFEKSCYSQDADLLQTVLWYAHYDERKKKTGYQCLILPALMAIREQFKEAPQKAYQIIHGARNYADHYNLASKDMLETYVKAAFTQRPGPRNFKTVDGGSVNIPIIEWAPISNDENAVGVMMRLAMASP
ncbi:MAG: hypothetical protein H6867_10305 [Rhodospirillales bacterium]|nr:hypothetical protein [Rhodospirillales bacterium]MCB9995824.1 hypothetical protein [Rhodospirillales bacterium]